MGFGKESFPVPELHIFDEMIGIIGMGIFRTQAYFHLEFFTFVCTIVADDYRCVPVKIIFSDFFFFLARCPQDVNTLGMSFICISVQS